MRERITKELERMDGADATWRIALRMEASTRSVRSELQRMERDHLVERLPYSTVNNTIWRLLPANT